MAKNKSNLTDKENSGNRSTFSPESPMDMSRCLRHLEHVQEPEVLDISERSGVINRNIHKPKKTIFIQIVILIISLVFVVLFYKSFTGFATYSDRYTPNCNFSSEQQLNITHDEGLVAYFRFNNYSFLNEKDDFICDISGKNHTGIIYNATLNSTGGVFGDGAFEFDGLGDYIEIADSDDFSPNYTGNRFSVSFWVKFDDTSFIGEGTYDDYKNYLGKSTWGEGYEWEFRQYNSSNIENRGNRLSFYAFNITGGLGSGNYVQENITLGEWIYLVGTINGTHTAIYKNGVFKGTSPLSNYGIHLENGNSSLRIGTTDFTTFLNGSIDEFRVYNRTLNSSEISSIYHEDLQRRNISFSINQTNVSEPVGSTNSGNNPSEYSGSSSGGTSYFASPNKSNEKRINDFTLPINETSISNNLNESYLENSSNNPNKTATESNNKNILTGKTIEDDKLNKKNNGLILKVRDYVVAKKKGFLLAGAIIFVSSFLSIVVQYLIFKHRKTYELSA